LGFGEGDGEFNNTLNFKTQERIEGGTSGGPIVGENGEILGVMSYSNSRPGGIAVEGENEGSFGRVQECLPVWIASEVFDDDALDAP
jgi:hypothetical protein